MSEIAAAVALAFAALAAVHAVRYRRRLFHVLGRVRGSIPTIDLDMFDERFRENASGRTVAAEVAFIGASDRIGSGTSDREAWIIAQLARDANTMFEIGTATGRTTYLLARNSPADARVVTLTLSPDDVAEYTSQSGDRVAAEHAARDESTFTSYLYTGTNVEAKVTQLYGDSKSFDETPWLLQCDLIFIDGSHAYSYVKSDSEKALRMIRPGGVVLWHDYRDHHRVTADVYRYLSELNAQRPLVHLRGTSLVAYRAAARSAGA